MEIKNRLQALHTLTTMCRMEISGEDSKNWKKYCAMWEAVENYFDPLRKAEKGHFHGIDTAWILFAYTKWA